ncbi:hypothetical protein [Streptomyces flaveolus]|uniref:hypothetical protein n=1 Tax=Streptomyces flaveolus TaxID=67297 RepID=UPI00380B13C4
MSVGGLAAPVLGALAGATSPRAAPQPLVVLPTLGGLLLHGLREPVREPSVGRAASHDAGVR